MPRNCEIKLGRWQVCFRPARNAMDQIFTLMQISEKFWEYAKDVFVCFVDLEKAYDRVPRDKLWRELQGYGINGHLLMAITPRCCQPEVCICLSGKHSKSFDVRVGLRHGCVLLPLLFIIYLNWINKLSRTDECVTIGRCKISRLLFVDDLVLLASSESGLQTNKMALLYRGSWLESFGT